MTYTDFETAMRGAAYSLHHSAERMSSYAAELLHAPTLSDVYAQFLRDTLADVTRDVKQVLTLHEERERQTRQTRQTRHVPADEPVTVNFEDAFVPLVAAFAPLADQADADKTDADKTDKAEA